MQPNLLNPYGLQNTPLYASLVPQATTSQGPQLLRVKGIESAKLFQTVPNSQVALFDEDEDILYIKTTDASNFPTIRKFKFVEIPDSHSVQSEVSWPVSFKMGDGPRSTSRKDLSWK